MSSLRWDGDILVFRGRIKRPDGDLTIMFRYELVDVDAVCEPSKSCAGESEIRTTCGSSIEND